MGMYFHQLNYLSFIKTLCVKFQEGNEDEKVPVFQELINLDKRTWTHYFMDITFKSTGTRDTLWTHKEKTYCFQMETWDDLLEVVGFRCKLDHILGKNGNLLLEP